MRIIASSLFVVLLFAAGPVGAEEAADTGAPNATALWAKNCASCHGQTGKGDTKIGKMKKLRDLSAPDVHASLTREHLIEVITKGITDAETGKSSMKGFGDKLSQAEIEMLADHALAFGKK